MIDRPKISKTTKINKTKHKTKDNQQYDAMVR
jgi:hypothetical protein